MTGPSYPAKPYKPANPYNKSSVPPPATSMGELVPYQSGPKGAVSAPAHGGASSTGRGGMNAYYPKPSPAMQRRMMGRLLAGTLGRRAQSAYHLVSALADLMELVGPWGVTAQGGEPIYDHPPGAVKIQDCGNAVTHGPTVEYDGSCTVVNIACSWPPAFGYGFSGAQNEFTTWRYLRHMGPWPASNCESFLKSEQWRAPAPGEPGELTFTGRTVLRIPSPLSSPQIGLRGGAPGGTRVRQADPLPRRRPDERRKGLAQRGYALAAWVYGGVDEAREAVDVIWDSMQGPCKGRRKRGTLAKAEDIARCAGTIDLAELAKGLAMNQLEDRVLGRAQGKASQATRGLRGGIGSAVTGPAL